MFRRLTILRKGLFLISVPLLSQIAFIGLVARMREDNTKAVDWTIHTKDVLAQAESCRTRLLAARGALQGYLLTNDPAYDVELGREVRAARERIEALARLVNDNEDQSRTAARIGALGSAFLGDLTERAGLIRSGRMDQATTAIRRAASRDRLERLDGEFAAFLAEEVNLDADRHRWLALTKVWLDRLLVGGVLASILGTLVVAALFARNISGRIARLTENSFRLAEGRELYPPVGGGDEIARLDRVFREMARTLADANRRDRSHGELIARRAEELTTVNAQLAEKAGENEMFVYSVSHDLRSPLVNLQGFSKELSLLGQDLARLVDVEGVPAEVRRRARTIIDTEMAESLGFIRTAVTRLSAIIDALLRLSRAGRVEYSLREVDVALAVARVVAALRSTIDERRAVVQVGDLPPAFGDPTAFEQVFANLIGNALNYLDPARPGRVEVFCSDPIELAPPGMVIYAVRDNGLGIAEAYRGKVFTAFQRLHGDVAKGEGIGLALVRRMVERHGGRIWFESVAGEGSTFYVALPDLPSRPVVDEARDGRDADGKAESDAEGLHHEGREVACRPSR